MSSRPFLSLLVTKIWGKKSFMAALIITHYSETTCLKNLRFDKGIMQKDIIKIALK